MALWCIVFFGGMGYGDAEEEGSSRGPGGAYVFGKFEKLPSRFPQGPRSRGKHDGGHGWSRRET